MIFSPQPVLVVGDLLLDVYTCGEVHRISPEAPVPVLRVFEEHDRPGGAGNALLNLASLGMQVKALGRVGTDRVGQRLVHSLQEEGVCTRAIVQEPGFQTPEKKRLMASNQQLVRVDYEQDTPLSSEVETRICASFSTLLEGVRVVAISDYAKGFLTKKLLKELIVEACRQDIPVIVDPKGRDFSRYRGATLLKPNLIEAIEASGLEKEASLPEVAHTLLQQVDSKWLMITRSGEGISLFSKQSQIDFPAKVHEVRDVTGAGDTVLAVITAAFANGMPLEEACALANQAAALVIERVGCARVTQEELMALASL